MRQGLPLITSAAELRWLSLVQAEIKHAGHAGMDVRLRLSRRLIWWPSIWWRPQFVLMAWHETWASLLIYCLPVVYKQLSTMFIDLFAKTHDGLLQQSEK